MKTYQKSLICSQNNSTDFENKCLSGMAVRGVIVGKLKPLQKEISLLKFLDEYLRMERNQAEQKKKNNQLE